MTNRTFISSLRRTSELEILPITLVISNQEAFTHFISK